MKKIKVFETFSGLGAQHKALSNLKKKNVLDFQIAATSEWYIPAIIAYNGIHYKGKGVKKTRKQMLDFLSSKPSFVFSLDSKEPMKNKLDSLSDEKLLNLYKGVKNSKNLGSVLGITAEQLCEEAGDIDLLTYSFPCQDLSMGASFIGGGAGMKKGSGTRSGLLWEIERIMTDLHKMNKLPEVLLLENVKNMIGKNFISDYQIWLKRLEYFGYETKTIILDSSKHGLPQKRERVFGVSILKTSPRVERLKLLDKNYSVKMKSIKSVLKEDYSISKYENEAKESMVNRTPSRGYIYEKSRKLGKDKFKFTKTLTTKQDRNPNSGVVDLSGTSIGDKNRIEDKANFRFLTPREQFLLMGFTEKDFENTLDTGITKRTYWTLAGNSIVVNVVEYIFKVIYE